MESFIGSEARSASSVKSRESLDAITNTIREIFASPPESSLKKPTKRNVLKRPNGQIMTEQDVIQQIEEKNNRNPKRSQSTKNKSIQSKQQQKLTKSGKKNVF